MNTENFRPGAFVWYAGMLGALVMAAAGCRRDMFNQPSGKPLEASEFFQDNHMASRPVVRNTVARGQLEEDDAFYRGMVGTNLITALPVPLTRELLERGRERFEIHCSVC